MKNNSQPIKSAEIDAPTSSMTVIGQFEGECADSNVTNENGLDILREVWETVFASDLYKQALEHGWYIGFLGHPEDPNCMDFEHACIVMRECHIADDGKVYGKFDLVDTPVGRIVKAFIDAGVVFGISVRGAGDIVDNSVDPDTFVFRGFDLVTFPAYKEAIPQFTEIAASSDIEVQRKYKAVCAAVKNNLDGLNSKAAIDIVQAQFAKQSNEYNLLENKKSALQARTASSLTAISASSELLQEQVTGLTSLYISAQTELEELRKQNAILASQLDTVKNDCRRKIKSIERIVASQTTALQSEITSVSDSYQVVKAANTKIKSEYATLSDSNLKYKQKLTAATDTIRKKDSTISQLRTELHETVKAATEAKSRTSNLDARARDLQKRISAADRLIDEYQQAYANLYANALGVHLDAVPITATTSVKELQNLIASGASLADTQKSAVVGASEVSAWDNDSSGDDLVTV